MADQATLPCEIYILIFYNAWACSVTSVMIRMQDWHASDCRFNGLSGKFF